MSNIEVNDDFRNYKDNKTYVVKVEDPNTGAIHFSGEVTIPTSGIYKLVVRKSSNLPRERSNSLSGSNLENTFPKGYRTRSPSLSGPNLENTFPKGYRNRSPSSGPNLELPQYINPSTPLYGNSKNKSVGGNRKRKTRRNRK